MEDVAQALWHESHVGRLPPHQEEESHVHHVSTVTICISEGDGDTHVFRPRHIVAKKRGVETLGHNRHELDHILMMMGQDSVGVLCSVSFS